MSELELDEDAFSQLRPAGYHAGSCGYCKDNEGASYYTTATQLQPRHYQVLMDRGWRRSGNLLYLPDLARSCCPHYTIRLPAAEFKPSRDQRQAVHRWNNFILGEEYLKQLDRKHPLSKQQKKAAANTFDLHGAVHKSEQQYLKSDLQPSHRFVVTLEADIYTEEKYLLYEHYQQHVHHEKPGEITRDGFTRFLCVSPLQRQDDDTRKPMGSFHQCYRLDGRLIAFAVLDLLPHAVSGVYFIYHKDFEKYSMGKLSALREATLAGEGGYQFYYMGYYIHDCEKMKYKATFQPQYVLDIISHTWDPFDSRMRTLMSARKFVSMSRERERAAAMTIPEGMGEEEGSMISVSDPHAATGTDAIEEQDTWELPDPAVATRAGRSLLELGMPGVMSLQEVVAKVDLDNAIALLGDDMACPLSALRSWSEDSVDDSYCVKGMVAELAGCLGVEVFRETLIDFTRH